MTTYSVSKSNASTMPALSTNVSRKTSPVFTSTYGLTATTAGKIHSKPKTRKSATKKKFSSNTKKPTETGTRVKYCRSVFKSQNFTMNFSALSFVAFISQ